MPFIFKANEKKIYLKKMAVSTLKVLTNYQLLKIILKSKNKTYKII
jgi:hypothetical protein